MDRNSIQKNGGEVAGLLASLRAVAEPSRLRILALCAQGELTVSELVDVLGQSQPRVSRHLKVLAEAGLLERLREGTWVFYRLTRRGRDADVARGLLALAPGRDPILELDAVRLKAILDRRAAAAANYFRRNALRWGAVRALHADEGEVEAALRNLLPADTESLLDIGTGTGRMLEVLARYVQHAQGIDQSTEMLAVARENIARARLSNCGVRQADMYSLPFPANSFDAVTVHQVLHFAEHPSHVIAEAARVLRPGGRLLVADLAPHQLDHLRGEHEHRRLGFSNDEVSGWFTAAGLMPGTPRALPGDPLTVVVWSADRPHVETQSHPLRKVF
ncbi:MAG: ArsR/SmtB family transcription factor [Rhodospirillales bacterium]